MRPWAILVGGVVLAAVLQVFVISVFGDSAALLQVGEDGSARQFIESELGSDIPIFPDFGHDGQSSYVIARYPFGGDEVEVIEGSSFRYRRWLFPALAGGFGTLPPRATVLGLAAWSAVGFGLAAAALVVLAESYGVKSRLVMLGVFLNLGLIISVVIVSSDALGLGLGLAGVAVYRKDRRGLAVGLLMAAVLTKEQFLIFAIAVAIDAWFRGHRRSATMYLAGPVGLLVAATAVASVAIGGTNGLNSNLSTPFAGLVDALPGWKDQYFVLRRSSYLTLIGLGLVGPLALWTRDRLIVLMAAGWIVGAVLASELVWREGTDTVRVFASFWPLIALSVAVGWTRQRGARVLQADTPD